MLHFDLTSSVLDEDSFILLQYRKINCLMLVNVGLYPEFILTDDNACANLTNTVTMGLVIHHNV